MVKRDHSFEEWACSVVHHRAAAGRGYHSLAHEIAHNFGCWHDTYTGAAIAPYAHGYSFKAAGKPHRTVMCESHDNRVEHFSNPVVKYVGTPTGLARTANNAKVFAESASTVAAFRKKVVP
jgi:hypothetical protein